MGPFRFPVRERADEAGAAGRVRREWWHREEGEIMVMGRQEGKRFGE